MHHPIFEKFQRTPSVSSGRHMYDFLGTRTRLSFRDGWEKHAITPGKDVLPGLPPANEHYFDWIAVLTAASRAQGTFRMIELGAGWAPWLVRGAFACKQCPQVQNVELLAVEADSTHFEWVREHFKDNNLEPSDHHLLHGAVSSTPGMLRFPVIENPNQDYGASLRAAHGNAPYIEVQAYSIPDLLRHFSGPIDFMHVDIQGAEYDALPAGMDALKAQVKSIMIGTHLANSLHDTLVGQFEQAGWTEVLKFERNALCETEFGEVQFGDGFLLYDNPNLLT